MGKLSRAAATSQTLSLVAMEEASREGRREADLEHLLLALALNDQSAGQVLRGIGLTPTSVRRACAAQHSEQLAALGITNDPPAAGRIVFHETAGYQWSDRALTVLTRAVEKKNTGDAAAVSADEISLTTEAFIPASIDEVWALLADPTTTPT